MRYLKLSLQLAVILSVIGSAAFAGTPTTLAIAAGDNQSTTAGTAVPGVVCAVVTDGTGSPVSGVTVTWTVATGGGTLTGATQITGGNGVVTLGSWTLGSAPGVNTIIASSAGLNSVTFTATGTGSAPTTLAIAAGNKQTALVNTPVTGPVCAIARDAAGNPVAGVVITFGNVTGGGTITGANQVSDSTGVVTLGNWTLGPTPGANSITASAQGLNTITFIATAVVDPTDENIVLRWDNALLRAIQDGNIPPPIAARAMAMVHTGIFDAWAAYDAKAVGTRLGGKLRRPAAEQTTANKETAISYAAYRILVDLFGSQKVAFDAVMAGLNLDTTNTSTDTTTPIGIGNTVATEILTFRHNDGSNQLGDRNPGAYSDYTSYQPKNTPTSLNDPNHWQPLLVNGTAQIFLVPQWGLVTPFAIGSPAKRKNLLPKKTASFPSKAFTQQTAEIVMLSADLNDQTKSIAEFWADGAGTVTPPGHWLQFAQFVSLRDHHTLDDDVKLFFALSNAELDASIEVWQSKVAYDSVRPITAVHMLYAGKTIQAWAGPGKGTQPIPGETWMTYIPTPPFAEYVSGHSTFSAASAQILALFTKSQTFNFTATVPAGSSTVDPGVPAQDVTLTFPKFNDAADQAGISRRYGGIHFKNGDLFGRALGKKIATVVFKTAQQFIDGKAK
jgi:hypothetical protein